VLNLIEVDPDRRLFANQCLVVEVRVEVQAAVRDVQHPLQVDVCLVLTDEVVNDVLAVPHRFERFPEKLSAWGFIEL